MTRAKPDAAIRWSMSPWFKEEIRPIHNGATLAHAKPDSTEIECSLFCRNGEHCSVLFLNPSIRAAGALVMAKVFYGGGALIVHYVSRASEAGQPDYRSMGTGELDSPWAGWLVFWRVR